MISFVDRDRDVVCEGHFDLEVKGIFHALIVIEVEGRSQWLWDGSCAL